MLRSLLHTVVALGFISLPVELMAGGPPLLVLPVDGVTAENMQPSIEQLNAKLGQRVWDGGTGIKIVQQEKQWYLSFPMGADVRLDEVQKALEGTKISVPTDRLHLFGHVILEIVPSTKIPDAFLNDLKAVPYVSIEESKYEKDRLVVTIDMPYPAHRSTNRDDRVVSETFQRVDASSDQSARATESPATVETLPSYNDIREAISKHNGKLKEIRWSMNHACRQLGGVAEAAKPAKAQASASK